MPGSNLWDMLTCSAGAPTARLHCWTGEGFDSATWRDVVRDAEAMTAGLRRLGVVPGARVASVLTNDPAVVRGALAVWLCGGTLASLPVPARGMDLEEYREQLAAICRQLEPAAFVLDEKMLAVMPEPLREQFGAHAWQSFAGSGRVEPAPPGDDELAFVQYSSGSTGAPKGCMLTPRAIAAQLDLIYEMLDGRPGIDVSVSWLPLSHDMGMFGSLLTSWSQGGHLYLSTPERFMFSPRTWFGDLAEFGGHITAGTNTALHLAARAGRVHELQGRLDVKACIIGAERVEWDTLQLALESFGRAGFRPESLMPAYGLAEGTLAVTATPLDEAPRYVSVDAIALADSEVREVDADDAAATKIVSAGVPQRGVELLETTSDVLGEVRLRSASLSEGYFGDAQRTAERFVDGAVTTDDVGFVHDGRLYPVGRADDMISIGGRKVYAREIESAVDALEGVRRGCSTLIERRERSGSRLTLFVEVRARQDDFSRLAAEAASVAMAKAAVALDECVFLEKDTLPKTPSGKIQRHRCHQMINSGGFAPLANVELARA